MSVESTTEAVPPPSLGAPQKPTNALLRDRLLRGLAGVFLWCVVPFAAAGRVNWTRAWVYVALYMSCLLIGEIVVSIKAPGILEERAQRHANTKTFDKVILPLIMVTFFAFPVVAGLDAVRFGWSHVGWVAFFAGLPLFLMGWLLVYWTMIVNPHLEKTVRIQEDRGHQVVTSGPYAVVRHPMYAGVILQSLSAPLLLGSLWSYVPVGATICLFVVRTALEDRTLRSELPGYAEYAMSTRYRLLPGIW
ncbi:MAG TPA: isoprenylcysteine carboxylmethyltransferase family protein [Verrucomicrobiae bacterium]|nr:isoprenylcysteine carboxylmethyltransferase family protein [Verrucomicrobiae bacterium]